MDENECWWMMKIISLNSGSSFHCFIDLKKTQEMHSRESARVVRQILPAAQGIVARHAAPRLRSISGKHWGKAVGIPITGCYFLMGVG